MLPEVIENRFALRGQSAVHAGETERGVGEVRQEGPGKAPSGEAGVKECLMATWKRDAPLSGLFLVILAPAFRGWL